MNSRVVVGVDGSASAARALRWALWEATRRSAELVVVHAWQLPPAVTPAARSVEADIRDLLKEAGQRLLDAAIASAAPAAHERIDIGGQLVEGPPGPALLEAADGAEVVVVGTRGLGGIDRLLLGSVSSYCIGHARGPLVVVPASSGQSEHDSAGPPGGTGANGPIVVGVDGSNPSLVALRWALSEAALSGFRVVVVCAYSSVMLAVPAFGGGGFIPIATPAERQADAEAVVSAAVGHLGAPEAVEISTRVIEGQPAKALSAVGAGACMLVVGTRGLGGFKGLILGSTSHALAHNPPCPLAVIPAPETGDTPAAT